MEKEFIPYEQALELKELGFDEQCLAYYLADALFTSNDIVYNSTDIPIIKAPLYQQAFRWFREKYNLFGCIDLQPAHWFVRIDDKIKNHYLLRFETYEEAELDCLKEFINLVKNK
jgi:hypothetical protein